MWGSSAPCLSKTKTLNWLHRPGWNCPKWTLQDLGCRVPHIFDRPLLTESKFEGYPFFVGLTRQTHMHHEALHFKLCHASLALSGHFNLFACEFLRIVRPSRSRRSTKFPFEFNSRFSRDDQRGGSYRNRTNGLHFRDIDG
jgi:hypothetical protein